jgi:hypothetical protein
MHYPLLVKIYTSEMSKFFHIHSEQCQLWNFLLYKDSKVGAVTNGRNIFHRERNHNCFYTNFRSNGNVGKKRNSMASISNCSIEIYVFYSSF